MLLCRIKKKDTNEFNSKYKQTQTHKINLWLSEGKGEERDTLGVWD